jgi:hypothetical protein
VSDDWTDSLDRLVEVLRGQIALARAVEVAKIAVAIEDLERLLNIVEGDALVESER